MTSPRQPMRGASRQRRCSIPRPVENGNRQASNQPRPAPPTRQPGEIVGPHQQNEMNARKTALQGGDGIDCIACAEHLLDIGRDQPRMTGNALGGSQAVGQRRQIRRILQRIAGTDQEPNLIETQPLQGFERQPPMRFMSGIEGPAIKPDCQPIASGFRQQLHETDAFKAGSGRRRGPDI